jgi:hypothetical protein
LLVGLSLPHLPALPHEAAAAVTAELQDAFKAGSGAQAAVYDPRYAGSAGYAAAIVTSISPDGQFPLYRYPASGGGTAALVAAQLDWLAAPLVGRVRAAADAAAKTSSNHAVINYFHDGKAVLGAHSDKTLDLVRGAPTLVVSIGAARTLELTPRNTGQPQRLRLRHGSVVVLGPETNRDYMHEVVAEKEDVGPRLSVTLRAVSTQTKNNQPALGLGAAFAGLNFPTELLDLATGKPLPRTGLVLGGEGSSTFQLLYVRLTLRESRSGASLRQVFDGMATAERPGGPGTPGGTRAYSLWKDDCQPEVWHKLEIFANAEASNSVSEPQLHLSEIKSMLNLQAGDGAPSS